MYRGSRQSTSGPGVTMMGLPVVTRVSTSELSVVTRPGSDDNSFCSAKYLDGDQTVRKHNDSAGTRHATSRQCTHCKGIQLNWTNHVQRENRDYVTMTGGGEICYEMSPGE